MNKVPAHAPAPRSSIKFVVGLVLLVIVFAGFVWLGNWQVYRYHLKLHISHAMQTRVHAAPAPAPGPSEWPRIAAGHLHYLHVSLHGHYVPGPQTLVHGGSRDGYGYWVMAPFETRRGFIVLVNRGYVPATMAGTPQLKQVHPPQGSIAVTGLLRASEPGGGFLRHNQPDKNLWYSRDVAAIAASRNLPAGKVAPYFVDADAAPNGAQWPAAGLTQVSIYNHSLGYAITWYLLAAGTLLAVGILVREERRQRRS